ncbi:cell division cycle 5-like protein [Salvia splendens]|uniref:cell division cycle 5-like protein n=1 Tax=Salvia splendens TaxID=180675 RepID=UPI001C25DAE8|nr:cell division cycle 5-like protein [Salvia splendens]
MILSQFVKRSRLNLPAPQIPDHELEAIAKMGSATDLLGSEELTGGNAATRAFLANYAQTPRYGMTPGRTPQRTPTGKQDAIMMEAENHRRLTLSQTPLLGGDNPVLHPSDFSGVTPKKKDIATPNPLMTPSATPGGPGLTPRIGMTPTRDVYAVGLTPKGTSMRDELRINEDIDMHDISKVRQSDSKKELIFGLKNLPQPKNDYQIVIQPLAEEDEELEEKIEEDMSDRIAREKAEEEARQQALLKKRSKVLQRELPRPPVVSLDLIRNTLMRADEDKSSVVPLTLVEQADELVRKELLSLLEHDNIKYPLDEKATKEKKKGGKRAAKGNSVDVPTIDEFEEDELKELECFQALSKQETLAATYRISNLREEDQKQKDLERTLQKRYSDRKAELERVQHLVNAYRLQAERDLEKAAKDNDTAMDAIDTTQDQSVAPDLEAHKDIVMQEPDAAEEAVTKDIVEVESRSKDEMMLRKRMQHQPVVSCK